MACPEVDAGPVQVGRPDPEADLRTSDRPGDRISGVRHLDHPDHPDRPAVPIDPAVVAGTRLV